MTSAATDVISHNGRKIGHLNLEDFAKKNMPGLAWNCA